MKRQHVAKIVRMTLEGTTLTGLLLAFATTPVFAAGPTVDPAASASTSSDWLEVIVGFAMLLAIGLGGLWFSQHQLKFR